VRRLAHAPLTQRSCSNRREPPFGRGERPAPAKPVVDALELTILVTRKEPRRHPRIAARWLLRFLEEHPHLTIEEAALAASSLIALTGDGYEE
jgi:hypothetical protein